MKAEELKQVDLDYQAHRQAYLNFIVKAERKAGKGKTKPVYTTFKKFYNYKREVCRDRQDFKERGKSQWIATACRRY